ncbi:MAG: GHMP kinase [Candidatus Lokiarchaeota archaeon]|nr:GHMP kinase [Candidatus Lokiarchaeota archaeon]
MIKIKSPGRICLFGEHQDYLGYPIISLAISKYIYLEAKRITEPKFIVSFLDTHENIEIILNQKELEYQSKRDYIKSAYNLFLRKGIKFQKGYEVSIKGDIPINAGVASSSALVIGWLYFLDHITNHTLNRSQLALEGYNAEVKEFQEAGGMMDHFTSVYGNLIFLKPEEPKPQLKTYDINLDGFVLGNSMEKKATVADLVRTKFSSLKAFEILSSIFPKFNPFITKLEDIQLYLNSLKEEYKKKIIGNLRNRDITTRAFSLINEYYLNKNKDNSIQLIDFYTQLGNLLNLHHQNLRDFIQVSTNKIDKMISASLKAGALGGKINGSGFGGTMFALSLKHKDALKSAIEKVGGKADILKTSNGVEIY